MLLKLDSISCQKTRGEQFFVRACREYTLPREWRIITTKSHGFRETRELDPYWKSRPVICTVNMELKSESGLWVEDNSQSWVRISHGSNKFVIDSSHNNTKVLADLPEEQASQLIVKDFAARSKAKAKQQRREPADLPSIIPLNERKSIDIEPGGICSLCERDRIPSLLQHNALRGCCDARRQFRSSRFRAWILVSALETYPFKEMSVCFFPDGHGNGAVDGHFWMQTLLGELRCWHEGHQQHRCLHERPQRDGDGRAKNTTQLQRSRKASTSRRSRSRTSRRRSSTRSLLRQGEYGKQSEQRLVLQVRWQGSSGMLPWCTTTVLLAERHRNTGGHQSTPDDDAMQSQTCPDSAVITTGTARQSSYRWTWTRCSRTGSSCTNYAWALLASERLVTVWSGVRAWRQTLESTSLTRRNAHGIPCRTTARRR